MFVKFKWFGLIYKPTEHVKIEKRVRRSLVKNESVPPFFLFYSKHFSLKQKIWLLFSCKIYGTKKKVIERHDSFLVTPVYNYLFQELIYFYMRVYLFFFRMIEMYVRGRGAKLSRLKKNEM